MNDEEHKQLAANGLKEAKGILDNLGIEFGLTLGTVLGAYRDKDFCPGDIDDIDLFLYEEDFSRIDEIQRDMTAKHWNIKAIWKAEDGISTEYSFFKEVAGRKKIKVDLWFYSRNPDNKEELLFRMYKSLKEYNTFILPKRFYDKLQEIEFYGEKYNVPEDVEGYLEYNYGKDWKTPIHRDNWNYYTSNYSKLWQNLKE